MQFPDLPLLGTVSPWRPTRASLRKVALVCVQHLLETTGSLLEKCIHLGFEPSNIHALGKLYSTTDSVAQRLRSLGINVHDSGRNFEWGNYGRQLNAEIRRMWEQVAQSAKAEAFDRVVVLDDGGAAIAAVPGNLISSTPVIGVEQTMSGMILSWTDEPPIPYIGVGSSAAKVLIEPRIIREEVFRKIAKTVGGKRIEKAGVIGTGFIGRAMAEELLSQGITVLLHDKDESQIPDLPASVCNHVAEIYDRAEVIFGCTGSDHLEGQDCWKVAKDPKLLVSCSSKDIEFRTALLPLNLDRKFDTLDRLSDLILPYDDLTLTISRGGFPINFDGMRELAPPEDIQLTRALLLAGVLQAISYKGDLQGGLHIELNGEMQKHIVCDWLNLNPSRSTWYSSATIEKFRDPTEDVNTVSSLRAC